MCNSLKVKGHDCSGKMRKLWLSKDDFELFHQDITPTDFEFFRTHSGAFKRMWQEQSRRFWSLYVNAFESFIWKYGVMKDFPMKAEDMQEYIDEIIFYIRDQCVDGKATTARNLVMDSVIVTQHKHCIALLDKVDYTQNPFYMKETREIFRQLFGSPDSKRTFMKVLCGFPVYTKFAGSSVTLLRRWLAAEEIDSDDELAKNDYFSKIHHKKCIATPMTDSRQLKSLARALTYAATHDIDKRPRLPSEVVNEAAKEVAGEEKKKKKKKKKKSKSDKTAETKEQPSEKSSETRKPELEKEHVEESRMVDTLLQTKSSDEQEKVSTPDDDDGVSSEKKPDKKEDTLTSNEDVEKNTVKKVDTEDESKPVAATINKGEDEETKLEAADNGDSEAADSEAATGVEKPVKEAEPPRGGDNEPKQQQQKREEPVVAKDTVSATVKKKLHLCSACGKEETTPKTFKRCQKCRGKPDPKYYCSRDCQAKDWKSHKLDHKDNP